MEFVKRNLRNAFEEIDREEEERKFDPVQAKKQRGLSVMYKGLTKKLINWRNLEFNAKTVQMFISKNKKLKTE